MTSHERNLVLMIAKGEVKEEDLETPLTEELVNNSSMKMLSSP